MLSGFRLGITSEAEPKYIGKQFQWLRWAPWGYGEMFCDQVTLIRVTEHRAIVEFTDRQTEKVVRRAIRRGSLSLRPEDILDQEDTHQYQLTGADLTEIALPVQADGSITFQFGK